MTISIPLRSILLGAMLFGAVLGIFAMSDRAHAATCSQGFQSPALPGAAFGAPYSFTSQAREALISVVNCGDTNISVRLGNGKPGTFVYPSGYVWRDGAWQQISFIPAGGRSGAWLTGSAFAIVPQGEELSMVAYICESTPQGFQCGCRGEGCAGNGRWALQTLTEKASRSTRQTRDRDTAHTTSGKWLMAYYPAWDRTRLEVDGIDWSLMTHIAFGPVTPNSNGSINTQFDMREGEGARLAKELSKDAKRNSVTPMLFVGGGAEGRAGWVGATQPENVDRFARALVESMDELGYEGIDIDWEPLLAEDHPALERLARKLRELRPNMPMTLAVLHINGNQKNGHIDFFGDVHQLFDQINVMTYDMAGVWSGWDSWHHSALKGESSTRPSSITQSMQRYVDGGVPKKKLGIGAPFYGYCIEGVSGPRESFAGKGISHGAMSYRLIMRDYFSKNNYHYDSDAEASYLSFDRPTGEHSCQFITYMDERDAKERAAWARKQGYGGIITWSIGQQHMDENRRADRHPLMKALANEFLR